MDTMPPPDRLPRVGRPTNTHQTLRIINGDCRDVLKTLPDQMFDCIIADPPYGETSLDWDRWVQDWPSLVHRLLKPSGSMWVFGSSRMFLKHAAEFSGWKFCQDIQWEKQNGSGFHADRFKRVHESIWHFYLDDAKWGGVFKCPQYTDDATARTVRRKTRPTHMGNIEAAAYTSEDGGPRLMRSVIYCRNEHGRAEHPTQKPVDIVEPIIRYSCPPGGLILDPFAGSGTVGVAAAKNGMGAVLIEASETYARIASKRLGLPTELDIFS